MTPEESLALLTQYSQENNGQANYEEGLRNKEVEHNRLSTRLLRASETTYASKLALATKGRPSPNLINVIEPLLEETAIGDQVAYALEPVIRFTPIQHDKDSWRPFRFTGVIWEEGAWADLGDDLRAVLERIPKPSDEEIKAMGKDPKGADDDTKALQKSAGLKTKARIKWLSDRGLKTARNLVTSNRLLREPVESWDAHRQLVAASNGVLDLTTKRLAKGAPADYKLTRTLVAPWKGPDAPAPQWEQFLKVVGPTEADRDYLQLMAGTFLIDDILDHGMYLLLGPESTGKGTFAESLMKVLGNKENGIAIVPDSKLFSAKDDHPTALTDLRGRRMAWIDEMEFGGSLSESRLKRLTGDEDISARKMRENNSTFAAGHTFLVTTNAPLRATGDPAVWRRLRYIPFEVPVSGALSVATKNAAAGEEAAGILAWMAEGARRVLENPDLLKRLPPAADRLTRELNGESNHIADFVETMLTRLPAPVDAKDRRGMSATELRLLCSTWCRDNRYPVLDARTLGKRLADLHVATVGPRQNVEGEKVRIYRVLSKHDLRAHLPFVPDPAGTEGGG